MGYFNLSIDNDITYLLNEIGHNVKVNNLNNKAIVNNASINRSYDDKEIITFAELKRGDYIKYNDLYFVLLDEVNDKKFNSYYKAIMRRCNYDIKFVLDGQLYKYYTVVESDKFNINEGQLIRTLADTMTITLPLTTTSKAIKEGARFIKFGKAWVIEGIDLTENGLLHLKCKVNSIDPNKDDRENEIADKDKLLNPDNIEPILPFVEGVPNYNVTFHTFDRVTQETIGSGTVVLTDILGHITQLNIGQTYEVVSGLYTYETVVGGYKVATDTIDIQADTTKFIFLEVQPPTYSITFSITPTDATIILLDDTETVVELVEGAYIVESGIYTYTIEKEGYISITDTIEVIDTDIVEIVELVEDIPVGDNYELIINGQSAIMLMQSATYTIETYNNNIETGHEVTFTVSNNLANIKSQDGRNCVIGTNTNWNVGEVTLRATMKDDETVFVEKVIGIQGF